jgi:hypothetical protein
MIKEGSKHRILTSSEKSCIIIATGVVRMQATPAERAKKQYLFQGSKREETRTTRQ